MKASHPNQSYSVLLLYTHMSLGGAQKLLLEQALWLHEHGHKVKAVFFYQKENLYETWSEIYPFPFYVLSQFKKTSNWFSRTGNIVRGVWNLWKILRAEKFDIMIAYTHDSNVIGIPLAWLMGVPARIASHHGIIDQMPRWREIFHTNMVNWGIASVLIAVSNKTRNSALEEGIRPDRIKLIINGVPIVDVETVDKVQTRRELSLSPDELLILSVGRLMPQKAHDVLVAAAPDVVKKIPNAKIGICGDGEQHLLLDAQIAKLGMQNSIIMFGNQENISRFLAIADIFVLPSRSEGMPLALLEAMSAGLPVVATQLEGIAEVVQDGVQGFLVPSEDPVAMADAIVRLASAPELRRIMGAAARKKTQSMYTTDAMCQEYMRVILKYLPNKG